MKNIVFFFILLLFCPSFQIFSQNNFPIGGIVKEKNGDFIPGANIFLNGKAAAVSDEKGFFSLIFTQKTPSEIKISAVGFKTLTIKTDFGKAAETLKNIVLEEDFLNVHQVVVSGTRNEIMRKDAVISCNLLDNKTLQNTQSQNLCEGLNFQTAVRTETNCQNCGFTSLRMNGLEGAYSLILVDGKPVFSSLQSVYGLEQIPAAMIERVEVIRSGGSALYGSSAIAGTLNVITREAKNKEVFFSQQTSLIMGESPDANFSGGKSFLSNSGNFGLTAYGGLRSRQSWDANGDDFSEITKIRSGNAGIKSFLKISKKFILRWQAYSLFEYRRGGNLLHLRPHESDLAEELKHQIYHGNVGGEYFWNDKKQKIAFYSALQKINRQSYYGSRHADAYGKTEDLTSTSGIQFSHFFKKFIAGENTFTAGMEVNVNFLSDKIAAINRISEQKAQFLGFYLQNDMKIGKFLSLLLGLRADKQNLMKKTVVSPRVNLLIDCTEHLQIRTGFARGFRAPQIFNEDLHISQAGGAMLRIVQDDNLRPEYSRTANLSVDFAEQKPEFAFALSLEGFFTQLKGIFIYEENGKDSSENILMLKKNGSGAKVYGVSLSPKFVLKNTLDFAAGLTWQKSLYDEKVRWSENAASTRLFLRTPSFYGFYTLNFEKYKTLKISLSGVLTGKMLAPHFGGYVSEDVLRETQSFFEQNIRLSRDFSFGEKTTAEIFFGMQNCFNSFQSDFDKGVLRDAAYVYGPARPRTLFLGVNFKIL
jgi:outer membrane receptor for ferrienterochelin and colicins